MPAATARWDTPSAAGPRAPSSRRSRLKPGATCCNRAKLRISRPAPISSATDNATSAMVSAERECAGGPRRMWRRANRHAAPPADRDAPTGSPAPIQTPPSSTAPRRWRTATTRRSIDSSSSLGTDAGPSAISSCMAAKAMPMPSAAASDGDQRRFEQQLPRHPRSRCAHRRANRQLLLAAGAARQQQIDDVAAGDEQDEAHRAEQHEQRSARRVRNQPVVEAEHAHAPALVGFRILLPQPRGDRFELGGGLLDRIAVGQPADHRQPMIAAIPRRIGSQRRQQIVVRAPLKDWPAGRQSPCRAASST